MNLRLRKRLADLPMVSHWQKSRFNKKFENNEAVGCCRGVFDSYALAAANAPPHLPLGYDHAGPAGMYRDHLASVTASDYPIMLWLQNALADGALNIFDLGGHIGLAYYVYQRYMSFPKNLSWTVNDVAAVVSAGKREALELDPARQLHFTERFDEANGCDVLFTAGCLQYLENTLADLIASLTRPPPWLLVNLLPLHERLSYWTVQSIRTAYCPYRIQQSQTFFSDVERLGYRLVDRWENLDKDCWIAFEPEYSLDRYYGAAFKKI